CWWCAQWGYLVKKDDWWVCSSCGIAQRKVESISAKPFGAISKEALKLAKDNELPVDSIDLIDQVQTIITAAERDIGLFAFPRTRTDQESLMWAYHVQHVLGETLKALESFDCEDMAGEDLIQDRAEEAHEKAHKAGEG
ncbi:hypothetical protein KAR91_26230, partial [Candidatus Pacearchaeota archaeon]|nr:hypothetical protein [Candidatus Pacearchaeota archaeon]